MDLSFCYLLCCLLAVCVTLSECSNFYQPRISITVGGVSVNRVGEYASFAETPLDVKAATPIVTDGNFGCQRINASNFTLPIRIEPRNAVILSPLSGGCSAYRRAAWAYTHGLPAVVFYYFPSEKKIHSHDSNDLPITVAIVQLKESELANFRKTQSSPFSDFGRISIVGEYPNIFRNSRTFYFVVFAFCILMTLSCMWFAMSYVKKFRYSMRARRRRAETQNEIRRVMSALPVRSHRVSKGNEEYTCAVCLELFKNKDSIRTLPCDHEFHKKCIDPWIKIKRTCPMCKQNISENIPHGNRRRKTNRSTGSRLSTSTSTRVVPRNERIERQASLLDNASIESSDSDTQTEATAPRENSESSNIRVVMIQPSLDAVRVHTNEEPPVERPPAHVAVLLEGDDVTVHPHTLTLD